MEPQPDADPTLPRHLLTQKEYARRRGWSKQYVNQLVKQGRIALTNGRIDPAAADAALGGMRDPSRGPQVRGDSMPQAMAASQPNLGADPAPGLQGTFTKARTVREHFRAMREKMEFEAATGELVRRREIEEAAYEIGAVFREHMVRAAEPIGNQIAERFGVDPREALELVTSGINQALQQLAAQIRDDEWGFDRGLPAQSSDRGSSER
jgi:hypothetical protein